MKSSPGTIKQVTEWIENALKEKPDERKLMREKRMKRVKKEKQRYGF